MTTATKELQAGASTRWRDDRYVTTWQRFDDVVGASQQHLLERLSDFPDSVLVTGCQRSGTTMLSRVIQASDQMTSYCFGPDDELDAALLLSGYVEHAPQGRYCFQTTYLNERYGEYFEHPADNKIIWVLRNPAAVVRSMLGNWEDSALTRVFESCGAPHADRFDGLAYRLFGTGGVSRERQACWSYYGKLRQLFELKRRRPENTLLVIDYDDLVLQPSRTLRTVFDFIAVPWLERYAAPIHQRSVRPALPPRNRPGAAWGRCLAIYEESRALIQPS